MANTNTLTAALDRILAGVLPVLRKNCQMPKLVNSTYSPLAGGQGSTLEVSVPGAVSAAAVTPSYVPPDTAGVTPTVVSIALDNWYDAAFFLSDKDVMDVRDGVVNGQMEACVKALAEQVNSDLLALYKGFYGFAGAAGTTPFATGLDEAAAARKILGNQLCPLPDRSGVIDLDAEANFSLVPTVLKANERGTQETIREGSIGRILGVDWWADQQVAYHTTGAVGTVLTDSGSTFLALTTVHFDGLTTKPSVGDIFTVAGDTQTYVVTAATDLVGTDSDVSIYPAAAVNWGDDAAVTFKASHRANIVFNRYALAFVNRPFNGGIMNGRSAGVFSTITDPVSGLSIRVELSREHKRDKLSFDMLYGVKNVRPELGTRLPG